MDRQTKQRIFELALFTGIPIALWTLYIHALWQPLFFGVVLAILFYSPYQKLSVRFSPTFAALLIVVLAAVSIVVPVSFAVYYVVGVTNNLVAALQDSGSAEYQFVAQLVELVMPYVGSIVPMEEGQSQIARITGLLSENLNSIAGISRTILGVLYTGVVGIAFGLTVILFSLFYFLLHGKKLSEYVEDIAPIRKAFVQRAFSEFTQMTRVILKVTVIIGVVQGTIGGAGLFFIGTPSAFMWTIVMMVFSMMPVLGAGAVLIPTALVYLATGSMYEFWVILCVFGLVSVVDNFLKPRIVGQDMEMNGGLVLLSVVGGLYSFGAIGMIAGPIIFAMLVAVWDTYHTMLPVDEKEEEQPIFSSTRTSTESTST